ncbi:MAG: DUF805 domain-containing protein [Candidatus Dormibacteria bacterium]
MTYGEAYQRMWQNYVAFSGRATRTEYWKPFLINFVVGLLLVILAHVLAVLLMVYYLYYLYVLAVLLPGLGLTFRRLHDAGHSGGWWLIAFIPILGSLYLIYLLAQPTSPATDRFGPPSA